MVNPNRIAQYTPDGTPVPFATTPDERAATAARETARRQVSRRLPDAMILSEAAVLGHLVNEPVHFDNDGITQSIDERSAEYQWYESARWRMAGRDRGTTLGGVHDYVDDRKASGYDVRLMSDDLDATMLVLWLRKRLPGETGR